jgi:hypothetical protein
VFDKKRGRLNTASAHANVTRKANSVRRTSI